MLQLAKLTIFILLAISYVNCDDHSDLMKEVKELMKDMPDAPDMSSFISSTQPTEAVNWTELTTLLAQTHDPTMDSDDKPPNKKAGCTNLLWNEDQKYCWARCDGASTSSFWKTWCFTTKYEGKRANKVSCTTDEDCMINWKCKSSCGMFSPHWDRENRKPDGYIDY